jgi:hypothetical protein
MNVPNILADEAAMAILRRAAAELESLGAHCVISPLALPQGMTVSLHVGGAAQLAIAAEVAAGVGGEMAGAVATSGEFASKVAYAIADAAISATTHPED